MVPSRGVHSEAAERRIPMDSPFPSERRIEQRSDRVEERNSLCHLRRRLCILTQDTSLINQIWPILINFREVCVIGFCQGTVFY